MAAKSNPIWPLFPRAETVELARVCGRIYKFTPADWEATSYFLAPGGLELVLERADRVIMAMWRERCYGYARLRDLGGSAILDDVVVEPECRGLGIGRQLLEPLLYDAGRTDVGGPARILCDLPDLTKFLAAQRFLAAVGFAGGIHPKRPGLLRFIYPRPK